MKRSKLFPPTKIIMGSSALILAVAGLALTFFPDSFAEKLGLPDQNSVQLLFQIIGAMYFGFAMMNWMSRRSLFGGIYNRPITIANMTHFLMVGIALVKVLLSQPDLPGSIWLIALIYVVYAFVFGWLLFRTPPAVKSS